MNDNNSSESLSDKELWWLIASTRFFSSKLINMELSRFKITGEQLRVLEIANKYNGTLTMQNLMELTIRQHNTLSVITNRMIRMGLLVKKKNPSDRKFRISPTPKGRAILSKIKLLSLKILFSSLTAGKKKQLLRCLEILYLTSISLLKKSNQTKFMKLISDNQTQKILERKSKTDNLSDEYIWEQLDRTAFTMYRLREIELESFNLTLIQMYILTELHEKNGSTSVKILKDLTGRESHSVTTVIARMLKSGLINRARIKKQRGYTISITPDGEKLFSNITTYAFSMTLSALNTKQKQQLVSCLTPLYNYLRTCFVNAS
jgi:DNA-binding MarR family transcriptional regulator